jgi:hypothetical protein
MLSLMAMASLLAVPIAVPARVPPADTLPTWLRQHMETQAGGTGRWIADNALYQGPNEAIDAYGIQWTWGLGRRSLQGRLFGLRGGEEVGSFWEVRLFWHPAERRALLYQFGLGGAVGMGSLDLEGSTIVIDQVFFDPDGSTRRVRHESVFEATTEHGDSFDWADGAWVKGRTYVWKRVP